MTHAVKRRFARVYFDDLERDHPDLFYHRTALGTWLRLLILSEKAWPIMPELPRAASRSDLAFIKSLDMIEYLPNHRFVLRGWVVDREARATIGRNAVGQRSDRSNDPTNVGTLVSTNEGTAGAPGSLLSSTGDVGSTEKNAAREPDAVDAFYRRTGDVPGTKIRGWLNELASAHTEARLVAMIADTPNDGLNVPDYLRSVQDRLRLQDHALEREKRTTPRPPRKTEAEREAEYKATTQEMARLMGRPS